MIVIEKNELEKICVEALNRASRVRDVRTVKLAWRSTRSAEWTLREIEPRLDILDIKSSLAIIRELQAKYRMVSASGSKSESGITGLSVPSSAAHLSSLSLRRLAGERENRDRMKFRRSSSAS
jgi:hypothetical protein